MEILKYSENQASLWESLELGRISPGIISIVGAGGKTSVMFRLAEELKRMGKRVIVTTSTHIFYPETYQVEILKDASELERIVWKDNILVVGGQVDEVQLPEDGGIRRKLKGLEAPLIGGLAAGCDVLLIEADGARRLPLKVPADYEPVIIPDTDVVIGCVGLTCVGKTWEEGCFRPELALELLAKERQGAGPHSVKERIVPSDVACILTSFCGTRKGVEERPWRIVLNQADDERMIRMAEEITGEIQRIVEIPVVVTSNLATSNLL